MSEWFCYMVGVNRFLLFAKYELHQLIKNKTILSNLTIISKIILMFTQKSLFNKSF